MLTISMPSEIIKGKVRSCCFLGQTIGSARGLCGAAIDWVGFCATIIESRRDDASAGSVFEPYEIWAAPEGISVRLSRPRLHVNVLARRLL